ncbi:hypothetical protein ATY76_22440 [Rhizobium sp. R339]|nr:hypothetical protein ATY76_22440 [Rhizobium sp. R339]
MAEGLVHRFPSFRQNLEALNDVVVSNVGRSLFSILYEGRRGEAIRDVVDAHIAIFSIGIALFELWETLGVRFEAIAGHSLGEYTAAAAAGVISKYDGLRAVIERGRLIASTPEDGAMALARADADTIRSILKRGPSEVGIAAINSATNTVISGPSDAVEVAMNLLKSDGLRVLPLPVLRAGHSALMDPISHALRSHMSQFQLSQPQRLFVANVTGGIAHTEVTEPQYWAEHLRQPVQFRKSLNTLSGLGFRHFVEIGGDTQLLGLAADELGDADLLLVPSLRRKTDDQESLAKSVASLYCTGYSIDWTVMAGPDARRLHLPTYPFARHRHWIEPDGQSLQFTPSSESHQHRISVSECAYQRVWKPSERVSEGGFAGHGSWIIVGDPQLPETESLAAEIGKFGGRVKILDGVAPFSSMLDEPFSDEDTNIVFLGTLACGRLPPRKHVDVCAEISQPLTSLLSCIRSLTEEHEAYSRVRIWIVTRGAWRIESNDIPCPLQTSFAALGHVAAIELPHLYPTVVDMAPDENKFDAKTLAQTLGAQAKETILAIRNENLLHARLERVQVQPYALPLSASGVYLVIGGLGEIGLHLAANLLSRGAQHVVVAARNGPSETAHRFLQELNTEDAKVETVVLDVSDGSGVAAFLESIVANGQEIAGIFHLAGQLGDKLLTELEPADFEQVLLGKAQGAWNLHETCENLGIVPKTFVFFSSATAVIGNIGQANYAFANAFLDGLATYRGAIGRPSLSVNWGVWNDLGHVARHPELMDNLDRRGFRGLSAHEYCEGLFKALGKIESESENQIGFFPTEWGKFLSAHGLQSIPYFQDLDREHIHRVDPEGLSNILAKAGSSWDREEILRKWLARYLSHLSSPENEPGPEDDLRDLNIDSLSLIQLKNKLRRELNAELAPQLLHQFPTITQLAAYLVERFKPPKRPLSSSTEIYGSHNKGDRAHPAPLTVQQKRWLRLNTLVGYGHRIVPILFDAPLNPSKLLVSLLEVVTRHPILRYVYDGDVPTVLPVHEVVPRLRDLVTDLRDYDGAQRFEEVAKAVASLRSNVPDPTNAPSWQVRCLHLSDDQFCLLVSAQHIEFDGSGLSIFADEVNRIYSDGLADRPASTLPLAVPYSEYAHAQQEYLDEGIASDRAFFEGLFAGLTSRSLLPVQGNGNETVALPSQRYTPNAALAASDEVREAAKQIGVSPISLLLASYGLLVSEILDSETVTITLIRSGRSEERYSRTLGPFTMPFPVPIAVGRRNLADFARYCDWLIEAISSRNNYPSTDLINTVPAFANLPIDTYFSDFGLNFTNYRNFEQEGSGKVRVLEVLGAVREPEFSKCDFGRLTRIPGFHIVANMTAENLQANYWYHTDRLARAEVVRWGDRHIAIMRDLMSYIFTKKI